MREVILILFAALISSVYCLICDNDCSGHGWCNGRRLKATCDCFAGWEGAIDCSRRTCPYDVAWADKATTYDTAHSLAECSNNGLCNRGNGKCECFPGFDGAACQKSACPNKCSGHGKCVSMHYLYEFYTHNKSAYPDFTAWEANHTTSCDCDLGFTGAACEIKLCPKGSDPMRITTGYPKLYLHTYAINVLSYYTNGNFRVQLHGDSFLIPSNKTLSADECKGKFESLNTVGKVSCTVTETENGIGYNVTFLSLPSTLTENNIWSNNGSSFVSDFSCDVLTVEPFSTTATCFVSDATSYTDTLPDYNFCSNRGTCNLYTGSCKCFVGFTNINCDTFIPPSMSKLVQDGDVLNLEATHPGFSFSVLEVSSLYTSTDSSFDFINVSSIIDGSQQSVFRLDAYGNMVSDYGSLTMASLDNIGGMTLTTGGFVVSTGITVQSDGLRVTGGLTIETWGLRVAGGNGILVTGGVTVNSGGLAVTGGLTASTQGLRITGGLTVLAGGCTVQTSGMQMTGGLTIGGGGLFINNMATVYDSGLSVTGGLTINSISSGAGYGFNSLSTTINSGGLVVTGGITAYNSGLTVFDGQTIRTLGLRIPQDGLTINSDGLIVSEGMTIMSDGLKVPDGLLLSDLGARVDDGLVVSGGMTVNTLGMTVSGGMTVSEGGIVRLAGVSVGTLGMRVTGGVTMNTNGLVSEYSGGGLLNVASSGFVLGDGALTITGGLTVLAGGVTVRSHGLSSTGGITVSSSGIALTGGMTIYDTGLLVSTGGVSIAFPGLSTFEGLYLWSGIRATGGLTIRNTGLAVTGGITTRLLGIVLVTGGLSVAGSGLKVTGGFTIRSGGLFQSGGATITDGLFVSPGVTVSEGLTVSGGVTVRLSGVSVTGGLTTYASGLAATGGVTIAGSGLTVSGQSTVVLGGIVIDGLSTLQGLTSNAAVTIQSDGLQVANAVAVTGGFKSKDTGFYVMGTSGMTVSQGMSVNSFGLAVTGGITVSFGGLVVKATSTVYEGLVDDVGSAITSGGVLSDSAAVQNDGIYVTSGGYTITSGGLYASTGVSVYSGGVYTSAASVMTGMMSTGGMTVYSGAVVSDAVGAFTTGFTATGGLTVFDSGVSSTQGITVADGGLVLDKFSTISGYKAGYGMTIDNMGLQVTGGITINSYYDWGLVIDTGGLSINSGGAVVNTHGMSVYDSGVLIVTSGMTVTGVMNIETAYVVTSDRRLKENLTILTEPLDKVSRLKGVYFTWNHEADTGGEISDMDERRHTGLMAQDVHSVLPEAVQSLNGGSYLGVNYPEIVPLLIEAVRELDTQTSKLVTQDAAVAERLAGRRTKNQRRQQLLKDIQELRMRIASAEQENANLQAAIIARGIPSVL